MLKTKLERPRNAGQEWDWALANGKLFRVAAPRGKPYFDVLLMGQSDYVAININDKGEYDLNAPLRLYSVNGEFRMWVEDGLKGKIKGVRWAIEYSTYEDEWTKPHWKISGDSLAPLAIERIMGERVNSKGEVVD